MYSKRKQHSKRKKPIKFIMSETEFIPQINRADICCNMLSFKHLNVEKLFNKIMTDNNTSPSDSRKGDIFESIIEILVAVKCIDGLNITHLMNGDLLSSLKPVKNIRTLLSKKIHQGGNVSDISINDNNTIIGISVKYKKKISKKATDINDLDSTLKKSYPNNYKIGLFVKSKEEISGSKKNDIHKGIFDKIIEDRLLFDEKDVINGVNRFCERFSNSGFNIDDFMDVINSEYLLSPRQSLTQNLHQGMTLFKFIAQILITTRTMMCIIAHKPRSGKSILILLICKYLLKNGYNKILIMTSVPATINSFTEDLNKWIDFKNINYKLQGEFDTISDDFNGIVFCSVQYLKTDGSNKKILLKKIKFDAIITDEAHQGSSTDKTKTEILEVNTDVEEIRKNIKLSIFASGTPDKIKKYYRIPNSYIYEWEIEDEACMKELMKPDVKNKESIIEYMSNRHGTIFRECLENDLLNKDYSKYPTQVLIKHSIDPRLIDEIKTYNSNHGTNFGYSCSSLFALQQSINEKGEVNYEECFEICKTTDGRDILKDFLDNIISENKMRKTIMKNIEITQTNRGSRKSTREKPLLFIGYLPTHTNNNTISILQRALKEFLEKNNLWNDYNIEYSNSMEDSGNGKEEYNEYIQTIMNKTKRENKKGCILLLGNKGSVGITYKDCDATISLDDGHNLDNQKQRFSRALTEADGKTIGINVDMNIQRVYLFLNDKILKFRRNTKTTKTNAEILYYMYEHNMFLFDPQHFINNKKMRECDIMSYYKIQTENSMNMIDDTHILEKIICDDDMRDFIQIDFQKREFKKINEDLEGEQQDCPKGDKTKILIDAPDDINEKKYDNILNDEEKIVEIKFLINLTYEMCKSFLFPLLSLISCAYKIFDFKEIFTSEKTSNLIRSLIKEKIELNDNDKYIIIVNIMNIIIDNNEDIVNNIREIYITAPAHRLRELIEKHFIPTNDEKKKNAEIPTPVNLVDDMLNTIPDEFWTTPKKVFEPCCGKGNFVLGIFDKFYEGLKEIYPDEIERCHVIMTECIYYADLTALNVFITTEIMKCHVQSRCGLDELDYNFNNNIGNTLELNIEDKWNINRFNAVIGNPPYQDSGDEGLRKALNHNLWGDFINYSFERLQDNGYLLFITPCSWMSPTSKNKDVFYNNYIVYLNVNECEKHFKGIGSKFSFYLIQKSIKKKQTTIVCLYNKKIYNSKILINEITFLPNLLCRESLSIIYKFYNNNFQKISFKTSCELHNTTHKNKIKDIKDDVFKFPIRHTTKRDIRYSSIKHSLSDKNKILMNLSGNLKPIYDKGLLGFTQAQLYLLIENNNYVKILNSKLYMFIFKICKWSGFNIDKVYQNLPYIDLCFTDTELYEYFRLTSEEILLVEKVF